MDTLGRSNLPTMADSNCSAFLLPPKAMRLGITSDPLGRLTNSAPRSPTMAAPPVKFFTPSANLRVRLPVSCLSNSMFVNPSPPSRREAIPELIAPPSLALPMPVTDEIADLGVTMGAALVALAVAAAAWPNITLIFSALASSKARSSALKARSLAIFSSSYCRSMAISCCLKDWRLAAKVSSPASFTFSSSCSWANLSACSSANCCCLSGLRTVCSNATLSAFSFSSKASFWGCRTVCSKARLAAFCASSKACLAAFWDSSNAFCAAWLAFWRSSSATLSNSACFSLLTLSSSASARVTLACSSLDASPDTLASSLARATSCSWVNVPVSAVCSASALIRASSATCCRILSFSFGSASAILASPSITALAPLKASWFALSLSSFALDAFSSAARKLSSKACLAALCCDSKAFWLDCCCLSKACLKACNFCSLANFAASCARSKSRCLALRTSCCLSLRSLDAKSWERFRESSLASFSLLSLSRIFSLAIDLANFSSSILRDMESSLSWFRSVILIFACSFKVSNCALLSSLDASRAAASWLTSLTRSSKSFLALDNEASSLLAESASAELPSLEAWLLLLDTNSIALFNASISASASWVKALMPVAPKRAFDAASTVAKPYRSMVLVARLNTGVRTSSTALPKVRTSSCLLRTPCPNGSKTKLPFAPPKLSSLDSFFGGALSLFRFASICSKSFLSFVTCSSTMVVSNLIGILKTELIRSGISLNPLPNRFMVFTSDAIAPTTRAIGARLASNETNPAAAVVAAAPMAASGVVAVAAAAPVDPILAADAPALTLSLANAWPTRLNPLTKAGAAAPIAVIAAPKVNNPPVPAISTPAIACNGCGNALKASTALLTNKNNGDRAVTTPCPNLTKSSLILLMDSVNRPLAESATSSNPFLPLPAACSNANRFLLNPSKLSLSKGVIAVNPSISVKIWDRIDGLVAPALRSFSRTPDKPSDCNVAAAFSIPNPFKTFWAFSVGRIKLTSACLIPLTAVSVFTPLIVIEATAAFTSLRLTPALAAIGAILPTCWAYSPMVTLPLSCTTANWSTIFAASLADSP